MSINIPVVDLFAGPGGLGEGFSSVGDTFKIVVSAEMDNAAHKTLLLRAFFRKLKQDLPEGLDDYYKYCNGNSDLPYSIKTEHIWEKAKLEARQLELGRDLDNQELDSILARKLDSTKPWILIGGPPCQAYSLVGRARNKGNSGYIPENDHRHFLYQQYLRIIQKYEPAVFVMENVKGILSSKIHGKNVFHQILKDLSNPQNAVGGASKKYNIYSLSHDVCFTPNDVPSEFDVHKFIVKAEEYGIPQARHRVFLVGVREDLVRDLEKLEPSNKIDLKEVIEQLPKLRSKLTKELDSFESWAEVISNHLEELSRELSEHDGFSKEIKIIENINNSNGYESDLGGLRCAGYFPKSSGNSGLDSWLTDKNLSVWLNHEARGHMSQDLRRYLFSSIYSLAKGSPPKGPNEFFLKSLWPKHKSWETGKFADRFRTQVWHRPATTITSHISKDGHYFIHPDPSQARSLTVREAARLQTFPDNYFFQGNRTQQFHQVGNAVPPLLAKQIALAVKKLFPEEAVH